MKPDCCDPCEPCKFVDKIWWRIKKILRIQQKAIEKLERGSYPEFQLILATTNTGPSGLLGGPLGPLGPDNTSPALAVPNTDLKLTITQVAPAIIDPAKNISLLPPNTIQIQPGVYTMGIKIRFNISTEGVPISLIPQLNGNNIDNFQDYTTSIATGGDANSFRLTLLTSSGVLVVTQANSLLQFPVIINGTSIAFSRTYGSAVHIERTGDLPRST